MAIQTEVVTTDGPTWNGERWRLFIFVSGSATKIIKSLWKWACYDEYSKTWCIWTQDQCFGIKIKNRILSELAAAGYDVSYGTEDCE